jgi:hypothetical protein
MVDREAFMGRFQLRQSEYEYYYDDIYPSIIKQKIFNKMI